LPACETESEQPVTDSHPSRRTRREERAAECAQLEERVFSVKKRFLAMYKRAHAGHIGSSLSCAEILVFLKFAWMRDDDTFVLSKGQAVAALYALLAEANVLAPGQIDSFYEEGTRFPALPPSNAIKEIPFATGSLGHGLSLCAGMALGAALNRHRRRCFCLTSDGELDEGSVWEAALFIAHRKLTNVVWLIDRNHIQGIGRTEEVVALEPLAAKLGAFGFHVVAADGHDFASLLAARDECERALARRSIPVAIIAKTIKGHGIRYMQDTVDSHYLPMDDAQYAQALDELTRAHRSALRRHRDAG
jgi:transketolase